MSDERIIMDTKSQSFLRENRGSSLNCLNRLVFPNSRTSKSYPFGSIGTSEYSLYFCRDGSVAVGFESQMKNVCIEIKDAQFRKSTNGLLSTFRGVKYNWRKGYFAFSAAHDTVTVGKFTDLHFAIEEFCKFDTPECDRSVLEAKFLRSMSDSLKRICVQNNVVDFDYSEDGFLWVLGNDFNLSKLSVQGKVLKHSIKTPVQEHDLSSDRLTYRPDTILKLKYNHIVAAGMKKNFPTKKTTFLVLYSSKDLAQQQVLDMEAVLFQDHYIEQLVEVIKGGTSHILSVHSFDFIGVSVLCRGRLHYACPFRLQKSGIGGVAVDGSGKELVVICGNHGGIRVRIE